MEICRDTMACKIPWPWLSSCCTKSQLENIIPHTSTSNIPWPWLSSGCTQSELEDTIPHTSASNITVNKSCELRSTTTKTILVPRDKVGCVIGAKGWKINIIRERTNTIINVDTEDMSTGETNDGSAFSITGSPANVNTACKIIQAIVDNAIGRNFFEIMTDYCL